MVYIVEVQTPRGWVIFDADKSAFKAREILTSKLLAGYTRRIREYAL